MSFDRHDFWSNCLFIGNLPRGTLQAQLCKYLKHFEYPIGTPLRIARLHKLCICEACTGKDLRDPPGCETHMRNMDFFVMGSCTRNKDTRVAQRVVGMWHFNVLPSSETIFAHEWRIDVLFS
jgi:hypothetical protein